MTSNRFITTLIMAVLFVAGLSACSDQSDSRGTGVETAFPDGLLTVYTVNYPLRYFAERIGGPHIRVTFPAAADGDPAFWEPTVEDVAAFQQADLILLNGASYAKWVQRVSLPESRLVDTSVAFADRYIPVEARASHSHGSAGEHQHQAAAIRDALVRLRPEAEAVFHQRFASLQQDLQALDQQFATAFDAYEGQPLLFSHPVYQYLIRRYAITGHELHWEPDSMPGAEEWRTFDKLLNEFPARWMLWEGAPESEIAAALDQRGIKTLVFEPGANNPTDGDYLSLMRENLARLSDQPR